MAFVRVASVNDVCPGRGHKVDVNGKAIGLFKLGEQIYAIDDRCTHADASLCEGPVEGDEVVCPLHMATFDIRTGEATGPPACDPVQTYQVRVEGEDIEIDAG